MSAPVGPLVALTTEAIDVRAVEATVAHAGAGAVCTFQGVVRGQDGDREVAFLEYEAFHEMAIPAMSEIAVEVEGRWPGARIAIVHRLGRLAVGDASVVIAVACPHRAEAFEACKYAIDRLKATVPMWKKEILPDGEEWVDGVAPAPLEGSTTH